MGNPVGVERYEAKSSLPGLARPAAPKRLCRLIVAETEKVGDVQVTSGEVMRRVAVSVPASPGRAPDPEKPPVVVCNVPVVHKPAQPRGETETSALTAANDWEV